MSSARFRSGPVPQPGIVVAAVGSRSSHSCRLPIRAEEGERIAAHDGARLLVGDHAEVACSVHDIVGRRSVGQERVVRPGHDVLGPERSAVWFVPIVTGTVPE